MADVVPIDCIPPFRCTVCGDRVAPRSAWIWVDVTVAAAALEARQPTSETQVDCLGRLATPLAQWAVGHETCAPDHTGIHDSPLPVTYRKLVGFVGELLDSPWLAGTDLRRLLSEAAERSGRFAPVS